jgi:hypothetical protein
MILIKRLEDQLGDRKENALVYTDYTLDLLIRLFITIQLRISFLYYNKDLSC